MLNERERSFLQGCIGCKKPELEIIDDDMATLTCPTREMNNCWKAL